LNKKGVRLNGFVATALSLVMAATPVLANNSLIYGDADGDNALNASDAAYILSYTLDNSYQIDGFSLDKLDVDRDGSITASDAACILSKVLDSDYVLPAEDETSGGALDTVTSGSVATTAKPLPVRPTTTTTTTTITTTTTTTTTEATTETTTIDSEITLVVKAGTFSLGQSESSLPKAYSTGTTPDGTKWYSYSGDYEHYTKVGVSDGAVVSIFTMDVDASYDNHSIGEELTSASSPYIAKRTRSVRADLYSDANDNNRVYAISLTDRSYASVGATYSDERISELEKQVADLTNAFRAQLGLYDLVWNKTLASVARAHAEDMVANGYFAHNSLNGDKPSARIKAAGLTGSAYAENIAAGQTSAEGVVNDWINSTSGHRKNIVSSELEHIGIGFAYSASDTQGYYTRIVQDFYAPF
jgi:uncharacterized protein YkwD